MSGQPTRARWIARAPAEWRSFFAFLRNPVLPGRAELSLGGSARALPQLLGLDLALMGFVLGAIGVATALGLKLPEHMLDALTLSPWVAAFIVIAAPIAEETLFRGWLSGRPGHILAVAALIAGGSAVVLAGSPVVKLAGAAAGAAVAMAALLALRGRDALPWFQRHFRWFYYGSAALFAVVHLTNFTGGDGPSLNQLPLVLPQLVLGLILGYLRVNRGLMTGAALHMLHNSLFVALMLAGSP